MAKPKESTHQRIAPEPQQRRLPAARRTVRSGVARPSLLALKKQSTLTQLDFVEASSSSRGTISDSEDTEGDDDEDFAEPRPKKKQRKSKFGPRNGDQSSLTQKWTGPGPFKIEHGSDRKGSRWSNPLVISEFNGGDTRDTQAIAMDLREVIEETPPSSLRVPDSEPPSSARTARGKIFIHQSSPGHETTRPTTANSAINLTTPRKTFKTVIPSSNTPSSIQLSVHSSRSRSEYASSPLKERSCNRRTAEVSQGYVTARESPSPSKRPSANTKARRLNRINTVNDSQSEDSDVEENIRPESIPPSATNLVPEPRTLTRTITVQDSDGDQDLEDLDGGNDGDDDSTVVEDELDQRDLIVGNEVIQQDTFAEDDRDQGNTYSVSTYPQTFDPVSAAMERDAARFGKGPTQMETQYVSFSDQEDENDQTLVNDDVEFVAESPIADVIEQTSQHGEDHGNVAASKDEPDTTGLPSIADAEEHEPANSSKNDDQPNELLLISSTDEPSGLDINDCHQQSAELQVGSIDIRNSNETPAEGDQQQQPHSSPPPQSRPSQMSTVVPTQWTADRHESAPISPQKSSTWAAGNTLSSSPFPMPPWTFSNPDEDDHGRRSEPQFDSLVDFSLPPPPPIYSSMRQESSTGVE